MQLTINGQPRDFASLATLDELLATLGLKQDRVAVEHNGEIVARDAWSATSLSDGDRLEIVHFVGGGAR
ncbi:MAG: sulfur carrier protein ThiS [Acidobacteriaceae bacterium]|jgi:sulfur carrier protein